MENIVIDILPGAAWPVCHASQCDVGRIIQINIFDISTSYLIDGDKALAFEMKKPDGNIVTSKLTYTAGTSVVYLKTTKQMCSCPGSNICEISISKKKSSIATLNFILEIEADPDYYVESLTEIGDLDLRIVDAMKIWKT